MGTLWSRGTWIDMVDLMRFPTLIQRLIPFSSVLVLGFIGLHPARSAAQTGVVPQTAGQNLVRWHDFDWQYVDLLTDDDLGKGVRLYYYKNESEVAERAAAAVEEEYRELVRRFNYKPQARVPYILYNSHQDFEQSNVFFVSEHVLGITSTTDLKMALAYWGDHKRFRHTSLHEMVHQFTIQKVSSIADKARASGSPLPKVPLWFVEGMAEWYSTPGGIDTETEMHLRDLVTNQDAFQGFVLPPFLSDDLRSYIYTYKLGQGRIHFLAETYGEDVLQEILENSYRLRGYRRPVTTTDTPVTPDTPTTEARREALDQRDRVLDFAGLLRLATGDKISTIQEKWDGWLKSRYYKQYLDTDQHYADFRKLPGTPRYADLFATAHGGEVVVHRTIEPVTGFTRLYILDVRDPSSRTKLSEDGKPGVDSLHFFDRPIVTLTHDRAVWVARNGPNDVLYSRHYKRVEKDPLPESRADALARQQREDLGIDPVVDENDEASRMLQRVRFKLGKRKKLYDPSVDGIREIGSPAFSPDGTQLAFVGLTDDGVTDIFVLDLESRKTTRLTDDAYAEKELDWGPGGIVYNADATEHGNFNLFLANPITGKIRRIGWRDEVQRHPAWTPDGRAVTYSADGEGKMDVYLLPIEDTAPRVSTAALEPGVGKSLLASASEKSPVSSSDSALQPKRLTDFPTGITQARIVGDKLMAMGLQAGQMRLFSASVEGLETKATPRQTPREYASWEIPQRDLPGSLNYTPFALRSWRLEDAFAVLSSSAYGGGFLLFQDRMKDHTTYLDFQIFGAPELTSAQLVYLDRKRRVGWGSAIFHDAFLFLDPLTSDAPQDPIPGNSWTEVLYVERTIGATGLIEYPFSRYLRFTGGLGLAAVIREPCFTNYTWQQDSGFTFLTADGTCTDLNFGKFDEAGDTSRYDAWDQVYGDPDGIVQLTASVGYDTLARSYSTGPLQGNSFLLRGEYNYLPLRKTGYGEIQLDAQKYFRIWRTANLHFRGASGVAFGDQFSRQFFVWPIYNLRGIPFNGNHSDLFIGEYYTVGTSELQVPLDRLVRLAIFQNIEGIAAVDVGSVFNDPKDLGSKSTAAFVTGVNFNLAIFQFRLHFARPFDIGGLKPGKDVPDSWVTNFSIEYLFF